MLRKVYYFLMLISLFGLFNRTPFEAFQNILLMLGAVEGLWLFFFKVTPLINRQSRVVLNYALLLLLVSSITSNFYSGQDFISGLLAQNYILFSFSAVSVYIRLGLYNSVKKNNIKVVFIALVWVNFVYYFLANIFLDKFEFTSLLTGATYIFLPSQIYRLLIEMGIFYYFYNFMSTNRLKYLILSLILFVIPNIIELQRMQSLFILSSIFIYLFKKKNMRPFILASVFGVFVVCISYILIQLKIEISALTYVSTKFYDAIQIFSIGESNDMSAMGRVRQFDFIYDNLVENIFFGNGKLRSIYIDELYGESFYFHIGDLGIIGVLYTYGLFILPLLFFFFKVVLSHCFNDSYSWLNLYFIYILIFTIFAGRLIMQMDTIILALMLWLPIDNNLYKVQTSESPSR